MRAQAGEGWLEGGFGAAGAGGSWRTCNISSSLYHIYLCGGVSVTAAAAASLYGGGIICMYRRAAYHISNNRVSSTAFAAYGDNNGARRAAWRYLGVAARRERAVV